MCQRQWKEALWRFLFAGYHFSLTSYYFISHRAVSFGLAAVLFYTKLSPPLWLTQTVSSTRLSASLLAVTIAMILRDLLLVGVQG